MKLKLTKQGEEIFEVVRNLSTNQIQAIQIVAYEQVTEDNFESFGLPNHTLKELRQKGLVSLGS